MLHFCTQEDCQACPSRVVCHCLGITEDRIVETLQTLEIRSIKDLRGATGAGDGCTCCHDELREYLARHACVPCG